MLKIVKAHIFSDKMDVFVMILMFEIMIKLNNLFDIELNYYCFFNIFTDNRSFSA